MSIRVRPARLDDAPFIVESNCRMALETEGLTLDPATVRPGVRAVLQEASKGLYFLAEADGLPVGQLMITYEWSDWRNGNIWWIQSVYVVPEFRRRGAFTALYRQLRTSRAGLAQRVCGCTSKKTTPPPRRPTAASACEWPITES